MELFPNFDYTRDRRYTIRIANPRRYSLYLEYIDVHEPKAANVISEQFRKDSCE